MHSASIKEKLFFGKWILLISEISLIEIYSAMINQQVDFS